MPSIIVTGGCGFIGFNLVKHLTRTAADNVIVIDKLTYASQALVLDELSTLPRVTFVRADITDGRAMRDLLARHAPRAVLNLAAETHVDRSIDSARPFVNANVIGTFELLEAARAHLGTRSAEDVARFRFVQVSTDEVFGSLGTDGYFREDTPYAPNSPYAASKAAADHLARSYYSTYGLPVLISNCSNNYGPYQHPEKLIPLTLLNALEGRQLPVYGDGSNVRDWLHVEDHCAALTTILEHAPPGASYTVGADNERTNLALVEQLCRLLEEVVPARTNPALQRAGAASYDQLRTFVPDRPGHDRRYAIDASKIRRDLGWAPARSFEDGLRGTVAWYVEHRAAFSASVLGYDRERLGLGGVLER